MRTKTGQRRSWWATRLAVGGLAVGGAVLFGAPAAFAAGSGYTPSPPAPGGTATGLPGSVVTVTTIQPSGGTGTSTIGSSTISASVPAGTFSVPTQLVVTDATSSALTPPNGGSAVVTFGVGFYQNGVKVTGSFPAVTVTVSSPSITAGSTVYLIEGTRLVAAAGATVKAGSATFTITSDPTVEIVAPSGAATTAAPGSSAVPGGTTVQTGKPFLLEGGVAGLLIAGGASTLFLVRRRRRAA